MVINKVKNPQKNKKIFGSKEKVCTFALPIRRNDSEERQREELGKNKFIDIKETKEVSEERICSSDTKFT